MQKPTPEHDQEKAAEPTREPLFRRYQIKIKAGLRAGGVPTGVPPRGY